MINDASGGVSAVNSTGWSLPASIASSQVLYQTDNVADNYWGSPIDWAEEGDGWVMVIDDVGDVMDFVAWGYTSGEIASLDINFGAFTNITVGAQWTGDGAEPGSSGAGGGGSPLPGTISYTGGDYTEDFDSLGPSGTALPTGWRAGNYSLYQNRETPGSQPNDETLVVDDGNSTNKNISYNYGTTGSSDRAIGHLPTTGGGDRAVQVGFTNNSGAVISEFTLTYTGEQWRNWEGGAPSPEKTGRLLQPRSRLGLCIARRNI